jgi:hypothetical protein
MILDENSPEVEKLINIFETDWNVGTPPERMEKGLKKLNIDYTLKMV